MKLNLHFHTDGTPVLAKKLSHDTSRDIYFQIIKKYRLDGVAITNQHSIKEALLLSNIYPHHVIVGCEYLVPVGNGCGLYIIALGLTSELHNRLMDARWQGIKEFTDILCKERIAYFLTHLGSDIKFCIKPEFLDEWLQYFYAIDVSCENRDLAYKLAKYYGLSCVGGSLEINSGHKIHTVKDHCQTFEEFFENIKTRQVQVEVQAECSWMPMKEILNSWKFIEKIPYLPSLYNIKEAFSSSDFCKRLSHLLSTDKKISLDEVDFTSYLKRKETERIFSIAGLSIEEKKIQWLKAQQRIHECFTQSSGDDNA